MSRTHLHLTALLIAALLAATARAQDPPASRPAKALDVAFLVLDGVYNSELVAPFDIFHHVRFHAPPGMNVFTVGRTAGLATSFEGLRIGVDYTLENAPPFDVLVVPSAEHNLDTDLDDRRLIDWVRTRGARCRALLSLCDGAFVLAEAGLLDGRACTTFPGDIDAFRKRFPKLRVVEGVTWVADGMVFTGAGGAKSYEPALHLVEKLYGAETARGVGRGMVIEWDRETERHFVMPSAPPTCYLPGDRVDGGVTVEDAAGAPVRLDELVARHPETKAVVLTILAGAGNSGGPDRLGGVWCEDTHAELMNLRYLKLKHGPDGVLFVGVLCPPVFHAANFGYAADAFTSDPAGGLFRKNRAIFVGATQSLIARDALPFDEFAWDGRFRLLGAPADDAPAWAGRFKWFEDDQTYGTPTTWVLTRDLEILGPPFFKNVYESEGRKLRYTPADVERLIARAARR